jgi:ATP-binding cassette subfamily F protein 3
MLACKQLTLARAGRPLIENVDLQLHPGWRVGLVGANGTGKSSLFALFAGELHAEKGDLVLPRHWRLARVSQETPALPDAALDFVLAGDTERAQLEAELARLEAAGEAADGERIAHLHARYGDIDGYRARARAAEVLHGLGFTDADFIRPVAEFSGGWRVRLNLARALSCRADLLLLDEPTNHLDLDAVLWLEGWLKKLPSTLVVISHDRDFLDAVVDRVMAIEGGRLTLHGGNYSSYERMRAARLAAEQAAFAVQRRRIAHLQGFIDRFKAKASKARQAQSRVKALARMESVAAAHVDSPFDFSFAPPRSLPDPLLVLQRGSAGYHGQSLLTRLDMTLRPGCRIGLLGRNGAGKSTLIKLLAGEILLLSGERHEAKNLAIGYFAQHQLEQLRPDESPLQHLLRQEPATSEQVLRDYLGGFDFRGERATRPVGPFSGGEKSRLALALLIRRRPNLLLLDEPTNHLDLEMRTALCFALQDFAGGVVLVSHDRHLLRAVTDELWRVDAGRATLFEGDLDNYVAAQNAANPPEERRPVKKEKSPPATRRPPGQRCSLQKELEHVEEQLARLGAEHEELKTALSDPALYAPEANRRHQEDLARRQMEMQETLETIELRWLEIHEMLESPAPDP